MGRNNGIRVNGGNASGRTFIENECGYILYEFTK